MTPSIDERAIFNRGPVVVFKWRNTEGWPVEYVSPNAAEVFGYSVEQFRSGEIVYAELIHPDDAARVAAEVGEGAAHLDGSFVHEPYRVIHSDGSIRWLYDMTHVIRVAGVPEPTHFLGYVIDVTQRILAEQERRALELKILHTQKLESLGVLAGGIAHDFNNLLTGVLGEVALAKLAAPEGNLELSNALNNLDLLSTRAAEFTHKLLSYSKKRERFFEEVDLSQIVGEVMGMLQTLIVKDAILEMNLQPIPMIFADRTQLQQVVMNLITNASDSLEESGGTIRVTLSEDTQTIEGAEVPCVILSVVDDGCGMSQEVQSKLFDPFFTTKPAGHGLGLSAVQGIVRAHNGEILIESESGKGTSFKVTFPVSHGTMIG